FPPDSSGARPARQATGVLVDARRLVTCAHVLDTDIGVPDFIIVIPGFDMHAPARASSVTSKTAPFGAFVVARRAPGGGSNLHVAQKWRGSLDARYDYGVV